MILKIYTSAFIFCCASFSYSQEITLLNKKTNCSDSRFLEIEYLLTYKNFNKEPIYLFAYPNFNIENKSADSLIISYSDTSIIDVPYVIHKRRKSTVFFCIAGQNWWQNPHLVSKNKLDTLISVASQQTLVLRGKSRVVKSDLKEKYLVYYIFALSQNKIEVSKNVLIGNGVGGICESLSLESSYLFQLDSRTKNIAVISSKKSKILKQYCLSSSKL